MRLVLTRYSYAPTETEGVLLVGGRTLVTIERPWIPSATPGGKPFESCVPDGVYRLSHWIRAQNNQPSFILENPQLGVWQQASDRPEGKGRYLVLIHTGNWVTDVVGCIAVGLLRTLMMNGKTGQTERAVGGSSGAMQILRSQLMSEPIHELVISRTDGAWGTDQWPLP